MVRFADYYYTRDSSNFLGQLEYMPGIIDGKWDYMDTLGRHFDRDKVEEFKTRFYAFQGWDPATGYPKGDTLKSLGLGYVAEELEKNGKLGRGKQEV